MRMKLRNNESVHYRQAEEDTAAWVSDHEDEEMPDDDDVTVEPTEEEDDQLYVNCVRARMVATM
jgi:hypothetical protein